MVGMEVQVVTEQVGQIRAYAAEVVPGCFVDRITDVNRYESGENRQLHGVTGLGAMARNHQDR